MMFSIGIRYLCGWAMATHPADRQRPEWPPHPDRVFQALVSAHFETDGGPNEYEALRLLAALPAPGVSASKHHERDAVTAFVPVNGDKADQISREGSPLFPHAWSIRRSRQARGFPVAIPEKDVVYLIWSEADLPAETAQILDRLCRKVAAVGHSASLVQMWVECNPPEPDFSPTERPAAPLRLRVPYPDRLAELAATYEAELRPTPASWCGYGPPASTRVEPEVQGSVFSPDLIILRRLSGRLIGLESTLQLTEILRQTVIKHCTEPVPEWVSGHVGPDGPPSRNPHLAFLPLADVGHPHAEGRLLGLALAIPAKGVPVEDQSRRLGPLLFDRIGQPNTIELRPGKGDIPAAHLIDWDLTLDDRESRPVALRPEIWTATRWVEPSKCWATVTPIVLDRYPKTPGDFEATIRQACRNVGLPEPDVVVTNSAPLFEGVPHARRFPPLAYGQGGGKRFHTHAFLRFSEPIRGPVLLGAGRYRGYGLCRPWREES